MIGDFRDEYTRYRLIGERALEQVPDGALHTVHATDGNSAAMIVYHMSGNLTSRFTDFLTVDGEKPWRKRDAEFEERTSTREEMNAAWASGWRVLEDQLAQLGDDDVGTMVTIRHQSLSVHAALCRSLAHVSYHVGQIVLIARMCTEQPWRWISIAKGGSDAYNATPTREKAPDQRK